MASKPELDDIGKAKLLLVVLSFIWGLNWPAMKIALEEITPWTFRFLGFGIGALSLIALQRLQGRSLYVPRGRAWLHIIVSSVLNLIAFGLFSTYALLDATTSRVVIINYSMPVWASLMAWLILGERLNMMMGIGLTLCMCGLAVLVYPLAATQTLVGLLLALGCALSWAAGTIYVKWARIAGDLPAITVWQVVLAVVVIGAGLLIFQGKPTMAPLQLRTWLAVIFSGMFGTGFAYIIWFRIIGRLPTATAALGTLSIPIVGVVSSALILGERPTSADIVGFALIFAAAVCVLIPPQRR